MSMETEISFGPHELQCVHVSEPSIPSKSFSLPKIKVHAELLLRTGRFRIQFEVESSEAPFVNPSLSKHLSQFGLWNWDVVEVFLQLNGTDTYYEFVFSPLGQFFELEIFRPRTKVNPKFVSGTLFKAHSNSTHSWQVNADIDLKRLGSELLWGVPFSRLKWNCFSILGDPAQSQRSFWALNLPQQDVPDFHLPEHFINFL